MNFSENFESVVDLFLISCFSQIIFFSQIHLTLAVLTSSEKREFELALLTVMQLFESMGQIFQEWTK